MSFLNPFILFGLFAASLPIIIHLFTRTKSRTIPFSTLEFLKELQNQYIRRLKLRQILLLFFRTLIIILIILAFARPTLHGSLSGVAVPHAKTTMAIILDNSMSMTRPKDGSSLFLLAKERAVQIAQLLHSGDEAFLLTATDTTSEAFRRPFHDVDVLEKAVSEIKLNYHATDLSAAIELARRLLRQSDNINKEMFILSDLQHTGFVNDSLVPISNDIRLYVSQLSAKSVHNLAITHSELSTTIVERGKIAQVVATIANTGTQNVNSAFAQLYVDEKPVAQLAFQVNAGAATTQVFRFIVEKSGFSSARLVLEDDDLLADNERAFSFYVPEMVRIGLSSFHPRDLFYAALVLDPAGVGPEYYSLQSISAANLRFADFDQLDALFLANIPSFDQQLAEKLRQFVQEGGGLILVLGENIDIRAYNSVLGTVLELPQFIDIIGSLDGSSDFTLGAYDLKHPIFWGIFENQDAEISKPHFQFAVKVAKTEDIDPIMNYSNGDLMLFEKKLGQGVILVVTTGFYEQLSDITHRTIFAPLIIRLAGYAGAARRVTTTALTVGGEIRFKISPEDVNKTLEISHPEEKHDRLQPTMTPNGAWIFYAQTTTPGLYELLADGNILNVWSVELDADESILDPIDRRTVQQRYNAAFLEDNVPIENFIRSQRHGAELWKFFVIFAFTLLIIEMLIYRERGEVATKNREQSE